MMFTVNYRINSHYAGHGLVSLDGAPVGYHSYQGGPEAIFRKSNFRSFSHRFTRNLLLKALKVLIVGYVILKIIVTHNLPGFKDEPQSEYHFFKCFLYVRSQ